LLEAVIRLSISTIPSKRPAEYSEMAGFRPAISDPEFRSNSRAHGTLPNDSLTTENGASTQSYTSSENLLDNVNRAVSVTLPDTHREQPIEERVLRRGSLEAGQRAEIVVRVIAHASECHVNQRAVVGLERHSEIELARSTVGRGHPIGAPEDDSTQALAFKGSTRNRKNREHAMRRRPDLLGRSRRQTQAHQRPGVQRVLSFRKSV